MRIGINASFLRKPGTGIGQVTLNFLRELSGFQFSGRLSDKGISDSQSLEFFLYFEEEPNLDFSLPANFHIRVIPPWWKRDDLIRKILWERWQLPRAAIKERCVVFLSLYQCPTNFGVAVRHVMMVHDVIPRLFPEYVGNIRQKLYWNFTERGIGSADRIVAVSEQTKSDLVSELRIPKNRVSVAYPDCSPVFRANVDEVDADRVLKKYGLEPGYIYHGGGLEIRKNATRLLQSYAALVKSEKEVPPLVLSGKIFHESNLLATPIARLIRELGLENRVRALGFVPEEDLPALYRGALLFAYPSRYEGFGLPLLESFVCGTPALSGKAGALPELAKDAALLVDPESEEEIRDGMRRLLFDAALRKNFSEKGLERSADFSWEKFVRGVWENVIT